MNYHLPKLKILNTFLVEPLNLFLGLWPSHRHLKTNKIKSVLLLKLIEEGSIVESIPAIEALKKKFGRENIYFLILKSTSEILNTLELIIPSNVIILEDQNLWSLIKSIWVQRRKINHLNIDAVLDLEGISTFSTLLFFLLNCPVKVGFIVENGRLSRKKALTHPIIYDPTLHISQQFMVLADFVSQAQIPADQSLILPAPMLLNELPWVKIKTDDSILASVDRLTHPKSFIILNPNFQDFLPLRKWPTENFQELMEGILTHTQTDIVLTGRKDEEQMANSFVHEIGLKYPQRIISLAGRTTLSQLLSLLKHTRLLITTDSGTAHFAGLFKTKTIVLFGPETPQLYRPINPDCVCLTANLTCSPCFNISNNRIVPCPNNMCLKEIDVEKVQKLALELIKNG